MKELAYYASAAELAREIGVDRTTVVAWAKSGKLPGMKWGHIWKKRKGKGKGRWRFKYNYQRKGIRKSYPKQHNRWTETELYVLEHFWEKPTKILAQMLKRSETAIRVKKHRIAKERMENAKRIRHQQ